MLYFQESIFDGRRIDEISGGELHTKEINGKEGDNLKSKTVK